MRLLLLFDRPVVQIMGNIMTLATFREAIVHALCVGQTMTVSTLRYGLVLAGVAGCAGNLAVLGLAGRERCVHSIMTSGTELRSRGGRISQLKRLVSLMACGTVGLGHRRGMRLVTINTIRDVAMGVCMAEITGKCRVFARACNHLLVGAGVTGNTDGFVLTSEIDIQRFVRVVTSKTVVNLVMRAAFVTVTTLGDIVCHARTMASVTRLAIDFSFVGGAICSDLSRLLIMTFAAVSNRQDRLLSQGD